MPLVNAPGHSRGIPHSQTSLFSVTADAWGLLKGSKTGSVFPEISKGKQVLEEDHWGIQGILC